MDYFQKRVTSDMADLRHDLMKSIRSLTDIVLQGSNNQQLSNDCTPDDGETWDELIEKYAGHIPVNDEISLRSMNQRIKSDPELKMFLQLKFDRISGADAVKSARKMLNALCTVECFGQFTWLGTKETARFSEFHSLLEFIVKILESRFPGCKASDIIQSVVKQRTKSAGEAVKDTGKGTIKFQDDEDFFIENQMPQNENQPAFDHESSMYLDELEEFVDLK